MKRIASILVLCALLSACAGISSKHQMQDRIDILNKSLGYKNVTYMMRLNSTGGIISDSIMAISNKLHVLPSTQTLTDFLENSSGPTIAIVANSDLIAVPFIEGAIAGLKGKGSRTCIQFAGSQNSINHLQKITEKAGVPFVGVVIP